jgi:hypothetical protein
MGGKTTTSKICLASHLFVCCIESLSIVACQITLLSWVFCQTFGSASHLGGIVLLVKKRVQGENLHASHRINPTSSNVVTSNWVKSIPTYTSQVVVAIHPCHDPFHIFHHSSMLCTMHFVWTHKHKHWKLQWKASALFPNYYSQIMESFKQVINQHVGKLFWAKLLKTFAKKNKLDINIIKKYK